MAAPKAQYREKLVAIVSRRECVYKRAGELSVTFHERGGTTERVTDFLYKKIGTEQSTFRRGLTVQKSYLAPQTYTHAKLAGNKSA